MSFALVFALILAVTLHLLRRATPALIGLKERSLPFRWPWLEILGAALGFQLGHGAGSWPPGPAFWPLLALALLLLAACATDYLVKLIPDRITVGGSLAGLAISALFPQVILSQPLHGILLGAWGFAPFTLAEAALPAATLALAGALVGFALLELVRRLARLAAGIEAMGMGDSKLLMLIGAFLGPFGAVATLGLSFLLGVLLGGLSALITRKPHAPFGPALAAGAWVYLFGSDKLLRGWDAFQGFILALPLPYLVAGYAVLLSCVVLLILRVRRRAAEYEEIIEADYREIDQQLAGYEEAGHEEAGDQAADPATGEKADV